MSNCRELSAATWKIAFRSAPPELTTERFLEEVSGSPDLGRPHQTLLRDFLSQCDLVKFAHVVPSPESVHETVRKARRFVDETRGETEAPVSSSSESESPVEETAR